MGEYICTECLRGTVRNGICPVCGARAEEKRPPSALPLGVKLQSGRYLVGRVLGAGGYGITYTAWDLVQNRHLALKESFPGFACVRSPDGRTVRATDPRRERALNHAKYRFAQESNLLKKLEKVPEIAHMDACFEENGTVYYTMELLDGMDMHKRLQKYGAIPWEQMEGIAKQLLRALYALHSIGYIHRDVSPDNVFMLKDGTVRLIDFGNARRYQSGEPLTVVVKDKFAPAEQYQARGNQGPWTDIYALCVTIYYAMTSYLPGKAVGEEPPKVLKPLRELNPEVPEAFSTAVARGMQSRENMRYAGIPELAFAMFPGQTVLRGMRPPEPFTRRSPEPDPFSRRPVTEPEPFSRRSPESDPFSKRPYLEGTGGRFRGMRMPLTQGKTLTMGRGPEKDIVYPKDYPGVSRNQCSVLLHAKLGVLVRDDGSSVGTRINERLLEPGKWVNLYPGDTIRFSRESFCLR